MIDRKAAGERAILVHPEIGGSPENEDLEEFGFSGGPQSGVGAPGFVQMPSISRTQIKTSVSLPAHSSGSRSRTIVQDYLILFKPRLHTAKSPPNP